ncbi:unnamed protein product [Phytomonas sp. Hart1]|nr:unnamed protein product [Phytomonas sp. Hart1]|eukprot:CCW66015.1 unnamed protein product [Phytomonas sp. isolate Hart1]
MEIAEGRPRRANAGNLLRELLEKGLDSGEEKLLQDYDDATTDSSFTSPSDGESEDEVDSDFSDEEEEGTLKGELVETEATARRDERKERKEEKQRQIRRLERFQSLPSKPRGKSQDWRPTPHAKQTTAPTENAVHQLGEEGEDETTDLRRAVRHRARSTIPLATRLAQAHARAREVRRQEQLLANSPNDQTSPTPSPGSPQNLFPSANLKKRGEWGLVGKGPMQEVVWPSQTLAQPSQLLLRRMIVGRGCMRGRFLNE